MELKEELKDLEEEDEDEDEDEMETTKKEEGAEERIEDIRIHK